LKRLLRNKEHIKLLWWHKEDRKKDAMMRTPLMGHSGEKLRDFPDFADKAWNLRFGLSTDGINTFRE
jgi:hypothetical protein